MLGLTGELLFTAGIEALRNITNGTGKSESKTKKKYDKKQKKKNE